MPARLPPSQTSRLLLCFTENMDIERYIFFIGILSREEEGRRSSLIIAKNDLERHAHTLSGDAGADLRSQAGGATRTPTPPRRSPPMTCTIPLPNYRLPSR